MTVARTTAPAGRLFRHIVGRRLLLPALSGFAALLALILPWTHAGAGPAGLYLALATLLLLVLAAYVIYRPGRASLAACVGVHCAAFLVLASLPAMAGSAAAGFAFLIVSLWLMAWFAVERLSAMRPANRFVARLLDLAIPFLFGVWVLILWELAIRGYGVPKVLLPAPSDIGIRFADSIPILAADFRQTFLKAVLAGYAIGCGSGFLVALLADFFPFLRRGLLPVGNLASALPIIGVAPIMVMWFGFDWPSKAAVVVVMTFFPMLVNTVTGLAAAGRMERDMMQTYAASWWQDLVKLRLPAALPFVFNALKINSTLALIGAIVAEFFGTPIVGMGFRISTEVGRMNIDMVWAEIAVAALAGSVFYGLVSLIERAFTFWHPSYRTR